MSEEFASIDQQRRLMLSLGFGFVEEELPESAVVQQQAPPSARTHPAGEGQRSGAFSQDQQQRSYQQRPASAPSRQAASAAIPAAPAAPVIAPTSLEPLASVPPPALEERRARLEALKQQILACKACPLQMTRTAPLAGTGPLDAEAFFILDFPNREEDRSQAEFAGELGEMLLKITGAIKLTRDDVFLTYANKCYPPRGRKPSPQEFNTCMPYMGHQVELVRPKVIVCFGQLATGSLLPHLFQNGMQEARGNWQHYRGIPLMPTLALPYIQKSTERKKIVWEDLQKVMGELGK